MKPCSTRRASATTLICPHRSRFLDRSDTLKRGAFGFRLFVSLCYNSPHVRKRTTADGCVRAPRREFIFLSRLFTTRAQAEKERDKLKATFTTRFLLAGAIAKK